MTPAVFNATPFAQQCMLLMGQDGQLVFAIMVCATYVFDKDGSPLVAPVQAPVPLADEHYGEPGHSSLRRVSEAVAEKPAVDFILQATAHAPGSHPVTEMVVQMRIGGWSKMLRVIGDRRWTGTGRRKASAPEPFLTMPLRHERAFGGSLYDASGVLIASHPENPIGVGWKRARATDPLIATELPNLELPGSALTAAGDEIPVAAVGAIAPNWSPRAGYAGTYDKAWVESRCPLPPADMSPRFNQAAPADQQWPQAMPGAPVELVNLTPEGRWCFRMPSPHIRATLFSSDGPTTHELRAQTVHLNAEARTVSIIARHCFAKVRELGLVRELVIGEASPGWMRARSAGKRYVGRGEPTRAT